MKMKKRLKDNICVILLIVTIIICTACIRSELNSIWRDLSSIDYVIRNDRHKIDSIEMQLDDIIRYTKDISYEM